MLVSYKVAPWEDAQIGKVLQFAGYIHVHTLHDYTWEVGDHLSHFDVEETEAKAVKPPPYSHAAKRGRGRIR